MKRRNVDALKTRRPLKKITKLSEGFYTSLVVYVKLILLWFCVMGGDFILEFRLEYLYPVYLLLQSTYEAYKFQGIAFALLLSCVVVSVDVICLGVIPAPWLYLLGSLAVWTHVGWSLAPLGPLIILPTLLYIDGKAIRPLPTQTLCPLAAHCVGFPLVSLGFGLKSFIGSRLKQRTRNDVARQNELLYTILWDALPFTSPPPVTNSEVIGNGTSGVGSVVKKPLSPVAHLRRKSADAAEEAAGGGKSLSSAPAHLNNNSSQSSNLQAVGGGALLSLTQNNHQVHLGQNNNVGGTPSPATSTANLNNTLNHSTGTAAALGTPTQCSCMLAPLKKKKDDCCFKLESEVRKLRSDLHVVRTTESELRSQISSLLGSERNLRGDVGTLQGEHEALQFKYSALLAKGQEERQGYEKKLLEERKAKENAVNKQKKASLECSGDCKRKLREAERERENLRREIKSQEETIVRIERELQNVKSTLLHEQQNKETNQSNADTARLRSGLQAMQDQNAHLESSLSAETRLKLDLFSALGEARRQLSIRDAMIKAKEDELDEVRGQLIEILAVSDFSNHHQHLHQTPPPQQQQHQQQQHAQSVSPQQQQQQAHHGHPNLHQQQQHLLQQQQQQQRLNSLKGTANTNNVHLSLGPLPLGVSMNNQQQTNHQQQGGAGGGSLHSHMHPQSENLIPTTTW